MTMATTGQPMAELEQQAAAPEQMPGKKAQIPRFNNRVMTNFGDDQIRNIQILKKKTGGTENSVLRTAVDVFSYLNGLSVETDPTIYLNNFLVIHQNGDR